MAHLMKTSFNVSPPCTLHGTVLGQCYNSSKVGVSSECLAIWGPRSHMGLMACLMKSCKNASYRFYGPVWNLATTMVGVPSGCLGVWGPTSHMDHMAHFMKSCKILFLIWIVWFNASNAETTSQQYWVSVIFVVLRNVGPKFPYGPHDLFRKIMPSWLELIGQKLGR